LYFDFSAYGDIAIGLGLLIGLQFPKNFESPYKATNISDFWRRWHITLGAFLKQYLFIPLGGSKASHLATCRNMMIVMVLGGIWHGAGLGFVLWGVMHGLALITYHSTKHILPVSKHLNHCFTAITFLFVTLAWVPFKAVTIDATLTMYSSLFTFPDVPLLSLLRDMSNTYALQSVVGNLLLLSLSIFVVWGFNNSHVWAHRLGTSLRACLAYLSGANLLIRLPIASFIGVFAAVSLKWASGQPTEAFLYFQF
jgi:alginate O-acetyltransferase complex protein AlgI